MQNGSAQKGSDSLLEDILEPIAQREGVAMTDLPPLYETIDPEALEDVATSTTHIEFTYCGYLIHVVGDDITINSK
jgi:hypothetical protein